jgi:hypothetical protein
MSFALPVGLFGLVVGALGILGLLAPERLMARVRRVATPGGIWFVAGIRLLFGALLLLAADASRAPLYLTLLGGLSLISGVLTPILGPRRAAVMIDWFEARPAGFVRAWCGFVIAFGLSLVWAVLPGG